MAMLGTTVITIITTTTSPITTIKWVNLTLMALLEVPTKGLLLPLPSLVV
jgi:hypothetical protein